MEIRNLITFQKIVELGSFSAAADTLGYSQSTVTMQMKQLEAELGVPLFDRIGRRTVVNSDGLRFLKYADNIINESRNAVADLTSDDTPRGELRIGILDSICTAHLPHVLSEYHRLYPEVTTVIRIGTFHELSNLLNSGQIDILWIFDHTIQPADWVCAFQYESPITIVCAPNHPLAHPSGKKKKVLTLHALTNEPLILTERDCSYRIEFIQELSALGITPNIFLEIGNTEIIKKFVEAGLGLAVLPLYTVAEELSDHTLAALPIPDYHATMYGQLFYHKSKWVTAALGSFVALVQELL